MDGFPPQRVIKIWSASSKYYSHFQNPELTKPGCAKASLSTPFFYVFVGLSPNSWRSRGVKQTDQDIFIISLTPPPTMPGWIQPFGWI